MDNNPLDNNESQNLGHVVDGFSSEADSSSSNRQSGDSTRMEHASSSQSVQLNADTRLEPLLSDGSQMLSETHSLYSKDRENPYFGGQENSCIDSLNIREQQAPIRIPPKRESSREKLEAEIKRFEGLLGEVDLFCRNTEKLYKETKRANLQMIQEKFADLRFLVNAKEGQFIHEINLLYQQEMQKLQTQIGKKSLAVQVLAEKISEEKEILRSERFSEPFEEDLSTFYQVIQEAVNAESVSKISITLQEMKQNVDSMLSTQLSALERMTLETEDMVLIRKEIDLKIDEKLSLMEELKRYDVPVNNLSPLAVDVPFMKSDVIVDKYSLQISYPFAGDFETNMKIIQTASEDIYYLTFKSSDDIKNICQEDLTKLYLMRLKLPKVQAIDIELKDSMVADDALLDIFSFLFWKSDSLKIISCDFGKTFRIFDKFYFENQSLKRKLVERELLEKSALFLTDTILSAARNLKSLNLSFRDLTLTNKAHSSLNQRISQLAGNLSQLYLWCPFFELDLNLTGFSDLFVRMPNLHSFKFVFFLDEFDDGHMEDFILNTLPSLKNLKSFQLFLRHTKVTDKSIRKLFNSFPEEWLFNLTQLRVDLEKTNVTNQGIRKFVDETLKKFKALEDFQLLTSASWGMKKKIAEWEKFLSKEAKK